MSEMSASLYSIRADGIAKAASNKYKIIKFIIYYFFEET